jgi:tetratricopeptide (TPR) repeat protein
MANKVKVKCVVCHKKWGKRDCRINDDSLICPICCAEIRTIDCYGCQFYNQAGKYGKDKLLKQTVASIPEVEERIEEALDLIEDEKLAAGKKIVLELFENYAHIASVQYAMGAVLISEEQYEASLDYWNKAIELNPFLLEAYYNKAIICFNTGDITEVIIALRHIIEVGELDNPVVSAARVKLATLTKELNDNKNLTIDEFMRSSDLFNTAFNELEAGCFENAITRFKEVLALDATHVQSYGNIGVAYMQLNKKAEALKALNRALELDPNYEPAIINIKTINSCKGDLKLNAKDGISVEYYKMKAKAKRMAKNVEIAQPLTRPVEEPMDTAVESNEAKLKKKTEKIGLLNRLFGR